MSRSPLFHSLRRAFRVAAVASRERPDLPPVDELIELAYTRRRFPRRLGRGDGRGASRPAARDPRRRRRPPATPPPRRPGPSAPRIAIVGAGMAGLNAAYKLKQAGLTATIFEGANRTGGRMFTAKNLLADGLTTELGGEFIDSNHEEMLNLMTEFGLERLDTRAPEAASLKPETYFINGRHYTQEQAARAFVPIAKKILADYDELGDVVNYETEGGGTKIDRQSITQYLDGIGVTGWMRELIDVAYVTEYGLDAGGTVGAELRLPDRNRRSRGRGSLRAARRERRALQGAGRQPAGRRRAGQARRSRRFGTLHRLEAIRSSGDGLHAHVPDGGQVDRRGGRRRRADGAVLDPARREDATSSCRRSRQKAIRELGYGANAKVLVGFRSRPWEKLGYSGATYTDEMFQLAWANSLLQPGTAGGLTLYSGGKLAHRRRAGTGRRGGGPADARGRARVSGRDARAQRQGLAVSLADVPVDEGQLLLLQTGPVDDDRRLGRAAGRQPVLRR